MHWTVVYFATIGSVVELYCTVPETMAARLAITEFKDVTLVWDTFLLAAFWVLGYFVVYWIAGRTCDSSLTIDAVTVVGTIVYLVSAALTACALAENHYEEAMSRVQDDLHQQVCSTGPHTFVRHPMYSAIIMWCVAVAMVLSSV